MVKKTQSSSMLILGTMVAILGFCHSLSYLDHENIFEEYWGEEECYDKLNRRIPFVCNRYERLCVRNKQIQKLCARTCGLCREEYARPACSSNLYGCCWDNDTAALGPNMHGCPECRDVSKHCGRLTSGCHAHAVRIRCPVTCGVPCTKCEDDPTQASFCPHFQKEGFCASEPDLMHNYCRKTCEFCDESNQSKRAVDSLLRLLLPTAQ